MPDISLAHALAQRRTTREFSEQPITRQALENLLWAAQGITCQDGKRTVPSAHALHPLRLYVHINHVTGIDTGLYDVNAFDQCLTQINKSDLRWALRDAAIGDPKWITDAACIVIICADMATSNQVFADQKPHGTRGTRYVYLEAGAAAQSLQLQAVAEGLTGVLVGGFDDERSSDVLGLPAPLAPIIQFCVGYAKKPLLF